MDLNLTSGQSRFREEVRAFIADNLPAELRETLRRGRAPQREETVAWQRLLNQRGWAAVDWPKRYGGGGLGVVERLIVRDELFLAPAPQPLMFNVSMVGPVVLEFGTDEMRSGFLPKLANLDMWFCQGFSEPNAGSDLASLRTSAVRDGDRYVVNGQKIWTTYAHYADWMCALVRTSQEAKKQRGISMLLLDMKTSGLTVRPIKTIDGAHHVNEVFFDNVSVPASNLVGAEGQGWECAKFLLSHERVQVAKIGLYRERLSYLRELLGQAGIGRKLIERMNEELAVLDGDVRAIEVIQWRLAGMSPNDPRAGIYAPVMKLVGADIQQKIAELLYAICGDASLELVRDDERARRGSEAGPNYLYARAATIFGGSTEIQKELLSRNLV